MLAEHMWGDDEDMDGAENEQCEHPHTSFGSDRVSRQIFYLLLRFALCSKLLY